MSYLDLHSHSTVSDGTLSPSELARAGQEAGLSGLAICDHDTVDGLPEFYQAGKDLGFLTIGGVELSLDYSQTTHLLGLDVYLTGKVPKALAKLQDFRKERNQKLFELLKKEGVLLSWERLLELSHGGQMGRPHFARAMVEAGYCQEQQEAFVNYLGKGQKAYVDKVRLKPAEALAMLIEAGFAPVLAHPHSLKMDTEAWQASLPQWKKWGLLGLEVYHPDHDQKDTQKFALLAKTYDLVATGGSDFHGANKNIPISWVIDHSPVGLEVLAKLRDRFARSLK